MSRGNESSDRQVDDLNPPPRGHAPGAHGMSEAGGLREAVEALADEWERPGPKVQGTPEDAATVLRALLAAHPASEADEHQATGWQVHAEHVERTNRETLHLNSIIDELKSLLRRACEADAGEDCWFDHSGDCQAHGPFGDGKPCPYPLIRQYLAPEADPTAGERVAKVLRHMADRMLHQTDVSDEALRSIIDGWAGALHGAATLLDLPATPDAGDASERRIGECDRHDDEDRGLKSSARCTCPPLPAASTSASEPLSQDERQTLNARLHRDGFYAPAVRARILDALDDTLVARIAREVTRPTTTGPVDWDSPTWGGGTHTAASDDLGNHGRHCEDADEEQ